MVVRGAESSRTTQPSTRTPSEARTVYKQFKGQTSPAASDPRWSKAQEKYGQGGSGSGGSRREGATAPPARGGVGSREWSDWYRSEYGQGGPRGPRAQTGFRGGQGAGAFGEPGQEYVVRAAQQTLREHGVDPRSYGPQNPGAIISLYEGEPTRIPDIKLHQGQIDRESEEFPWAGPYRLTGKDTRGVTQPRQDRPKPYGKEPGGYQPGYNLRMAEGTPGAIAPWIKAGMIPYHEVDAFAGQYFHLEGPTGREYFWSQDLAEERVKEIEAQRQAALSRQWTGGSPWLGFADDFEAGRRDKPSNLLEELQFGVSAATRPVRAPIYDLANLAGLVDQRLGLHDKQRIEAPSGVETGVGMLIGGYMDVGARHVPALWGGEIPSEAEKWTHIKKFRTDVAGHYFGTPRNVPELAGEVALAFGLGAAAKQVGSHIARRTGLALGSTKVPGADSTPVTMVRGLYKDRELVLGFSPKHGIVRSFDPKTFGDDVIKVMDKHEGERYTGKWMAGDVGQAELGSEKWLKFLVEAGKISDSDRTKMRLRRQLAERMHGVDKAPNPDTPAPMSSVGPDVAQTLVRGAREVVDSGRGRPLHGSVPTRTYLSDEAAVLIGRSGDIDIPYRRPLIPWFGRDKAAADKAIEKYRAFVQEKHPDIKVEVHGVKGGPKQNRALMIGGEKVAEIVLDTGAPAGGKTTHIFGFPIQEGYNVAKIAGVPDVRIVKPGHQLQTLSEQTTALQPWYNPRHTDPELIGGMPRYTHTIATDEGRAKDVVREAILGLEMTKTLKPDPRRESRDLWGLLLKEYGYDEGTQAVALRLGGTDLGIPLKKYTATPEWAVDLAPPGIGRGTGPSPTLLSIAAPGIRTGTGAAASGSGSGFGAVSSASGSRGPLAGLLGVGSGPVTPAGAVLPAAKTSVYSPAGLLGPGPKSTGPSLFGPTAKPTSDIPAPKEFPGVKELQIIGEHRGPQQPAMIRMTGEEGRVGSALRSSGPSLVKSSAGASASALSTLSSILGSVSRVGSRGSPRSSSGRSVSADSTGPSFSLYSQSPSSQSPSPSPWEYPVPSPSPSESDSPSPPPSFSLAPSSSPSPSPSPSPYRSPSPSLSEVPPPPEILPPIIPPLAPFLTGKHDQGGLTKVGEKKDFWGPTYKDTFVGFRKGPVIAFKGPKKGKGNLGIGLFGQSITEDSARALLAETREKPPSGGFGFGGLSTRKPNGKASKAPRPSPFLVDRASPSLVSRTTVGGSGSGAGSIFGSGQAVKGRPGFGGDLLGLMASSRNGKKKNGKNGNGKRGALKWF